MLLVCAVWVEFIIWRNGTGNAMFLLATFYLHGYGVEKVEKEAFRLTECAAEGDNQDADVELAIYYREGIGTKKDGRKGVAILKRLYASGNGMAAMELGLWYRLGYEVEKDEAKAKELIALAHNRGIVGDWVWIENDNKFDEGVCVS